MRTCSTCRTPFQPRHKDDHFCRTACRDKLLGRKKPRARRGTTVQRGYGAHHRKLRRQWDEVVQRGEAYCWRPDCRRWLPPGQPWHLGHLDDRSGYGGPECPPCNLKYAAIKGNRQRQSFTSSAPRIAR